MRSYILYIFLMLTVSLSAQQNIDRAAFDKTNDSLTVLKKKLLSEKEKLKKEIESLVDLNSRLDEELKNCLPQFYIKKYGKELGSRIAAGRVWVGMTEQMLLDSYGKPDKVNRNKEKWGVFAQYYYGKIVFFFRDGKLIEWEERK